jgi:hypothetical protein
VLAVSSRDPTHDALDRRINSKFFFFPSIEARQRRLSDFTH